MNNAPVQPRLRLSALVVCAGGLVGLSALLFYGSPAWLPLPDVPTLAETTVPPPEVVQLPPAFTKQAEQYGGGLVATQEPAKTQIVAIAPAVPAAAAAPPASGEHEEGWLQQLNPLTPPPPPKKPAPGPGSTPQTAKTPEAAPAPPPPAPAKKRWELLARPDAEAVRERVRQVEGTEEATALVGRPGSGAAPGVAASGQTAQGLIQPARWAIPANPLRTIYRSQTLNGQLLQAIHSEIPGQLKIILTVPVLDKFGYDTTILPKGTLVIAQQVGQPQYANTRLNVSIEQLELPSGEVVGLRATVGEEDGSTGLKGKVNNHYGKLLLATGVSAILNIGVRSAAGTPGANQFFRNPLQEAAQDVGQGVQQEAQRVVDRELRVPPTISRESQTFCTIHLLENLSFQRPPLVVR